MVGRMVGFSLLLIALFPLTAVNSEPSDVIVGTDCDDALEPCLQQVVESGLLDQFTDFIETSVFPFSMETLKEACGVFKTTAECLRVEQEKCLSQNRTDNNINNNDNDTASENDNNEVDNTPEVFGPVGFGPPRPVTLPAVPTAAMAFNVKYIVKEFCTNAMYCRSKVNTCGERQPELVAIMGSSHLEMNSTVCQSIKKLTDCLHVEISKQCHVVDDLKNVISTFALLDTHCDEMNCQEVSRCLRAYQESISVTTGLDAKTCSLLANYTTCVGNATSSCQLDIPQGQPHPELVSEVIEGACSMMSEGSVNMLYSCSAFTACVASYLNVQESLAPRTLCRTVQGVIGCAAKTVSSCPGVSTSDAEKAVRSANHLALKAGAMGCGKPNIYIDTCQPLQDCKIHRRRMNRATTFEQACGFMQTFQSCAYVAVTDCNLTMPAVPTKPKSPTLVVLADITGRVCKAMEDQAVVTCEDYQRCITGVPIPLTDGELITPQAWCRYGVHVVECARFYSKKCNSTGLDLFALESIYQDFLNEGCEDVYEFTIQVTTTPPQDTTTAPIRASSPKPEGTPSPIKISPSTIAAPAAPTENSASSNTDFAENLMPGQTTQADNTSGAVRWVAGRYLMWMVLLPLLLMLVPLN